MYKDWQKLISEKPFLDALLISSSTLYKIVAKEYDKQFSDLPANLQLSLSNYVSRMSTRCTPFGLFAGIGLGQIGSKNEIFLDPSSCFKATSDLTFEFFLELKAFIEDTIGIYDLKLYPNSTIFQFNNSYRYIERCKVNNKLNQDVISEVPYTEYLEKILATSEQGIFGHQLINILTGEYQIDDITEAKLFVEQLLANQILVSDFSLRVTINDHLPFLIEKLREYENVRAKNLITYLSSLRENLQQINAAPVGTKLESFLNLKSTLGTHDSFSNVVLSDVTKTDLYISPLNATISPRIMEMVKDGLTLLNSLTPKRVEPNLEKFKSDFLQRYEYESIPLLEALDPDTGIGFGVFSSERIHSDELINGIGPQSNDVYGKYVESTLIYQKQARFLKSNGSEIVLAESDLPKEINWNDMPSTFSVMLEVYRRGEQANPLIYIKHAGGFSAANILSRFCSIHPSVRKLVESIIKIEDALTDQDSISAEIVYLPEDLSHGAVVNRPSLRPYEIPIFSISSLGEENIIPLSDILISMDQGNIVLMSKKHNKRILPRNTTVHTFNQRTNPIYYFLSALQAGNLRNKFSFSWSGLEPIDGYYPRVMYKDNIILSLAQWFINREDIQAELDFASEINRLRKIRKIPDKVVLISGQDNKLLIDFSQDLSYNILKKEVKAGRLVLEEYLFDENDCLVRSNNEYYNNEVIICFYKENEFK